MGNYVYVGNLASSTNEDSLRAAFVAKGTQVKSVLVMRSPRNERSRGFGFVEVDTEEAISTAIAAMNGQDIDGNTVAVDRVRERAPRRSDGRTFESYSGLGGRSAGGPRRTGGARRKTR
jgi:RNA recognition motif-containing protein